MPRVGASALGVQNFYVQVCAFEGDTVMISLGPYTEQHAKMTQIRLDLIIDFKRFYTVISRKRA